MESETKSLFPGPSVRRCEEATVAGLRADKRVEPQIDEQRTAEI